jgi:hypothetical protein
MSRRERRYEWRRIGGDYPNPFWDLIWFLFLLGAAFGLTLLLGHLLQAMAQR